MAKKKKKKKATNKSKAGPINLEKWRKENPEKAKESALKHGAHSDSIKRRYADGRTKEARQMKAIIQGLVTDLGGHSNLTAAQRLILDNIRSKLIVLIQISKYVERQDCIINDRGELLACLNRNFTGYCESMRRDLEVLFSIKRSRVRRVPSIESIIKQSE